MESVISNDKIYEIIAHIFDVEFMYVKTLFLSKRIVFEKTPSLKSLLSKPSVKFCDLFNESMLCSCANAIFFLAGDEDVKDIKSMNALFVRNIKEKYGGNVDVYAEGVIKRSLKYGIKDLRDYMVDEFSDLETDLEDEGH